jgi:transposase InsO family protein
MRDSELKAKKTRQFRVTTRSSACRPVAHNLLEQRFEASRPDEIWASDITHIRTLEGWLYLAVILDLCSRRVVGWSLRPYLDDRLAMEALRRALIERRAPRVHHSDRGSQYASKPYRRLLQEHGIEQSMSARGNCYDNAPVESFFDSLKTEEVADRVYRTREQAQRSIVDYLERFYNRLRRHSSLGDRSPVAFEALLSAPPGAPVSVGLRPSEGTVGT